MITTTETEAMPDTGTNTPARLVSSDPFHKIDRKGDPRILRRTATIRKPATPPVSGKTAAPLATQQATAFARRLQGNLVSPFSRAQHRPSSSKNGGGAESRILQQGEGYAQPAMAFALPFGQTQGEARPQPSQLLSETRSAAPATQAAAPAEGSVGSQTPDPRTIADRVYDLMRRELHIGQQRGRGF